MRLTTKLTVVLALIREASSLQCRSIQYQADKIAATLYADLGPASALFPSCSSTDTNEISFTLNFASEHVVSPSIKEDAHDFMVPAGLSCGLRDIATIESPCFRQAIEWLLPPNECLAGFRDFMLAKHDFFDSAHTAVPSASDIFHFDEQERHTAFTPLDLASPEDGTPPTERNTKSQQCLQRGLQDKLRILLRVADEPGHALGTGAVVKHIQIKVQKSVVMWFASAKLTPDLAQRFCSDELDARQNGISRVRLRRVLHGKGQHRGLETNLHWIEPVLNHNCHVTVIDLLHRSLFTDSDELERINERLDKANSSNKFYSYRKVNIEQPAEEAQETITAQCSEVVLPTEEQINFTIMPIHLRYQAPRNQRNSEEQHLGFAPATILPPFVLSRCNRTWDPVVIDGCHYEMDSGGNAIVWQLPWENSASWVFTIFTPIGLRRHTNLTLACSALFATIASGVIVVLTLRPNDED